MSTPTRIGVGGEAPYDIVVGSGVFGELPSLLGPDTRRVAVIFPERLAGMVRSLTDMLDRAGYDVHDLRVPDGESAKELQVAGDLWGKLGNVGITRSDAVVGVGGGATTDLAGFVAATWLRGVRVVHVPTTLLGMVDAAVGGKAAINTAEGKNLVGAFHPPAGVLCELAFLDTVPREDYVSGLAEVIKAGFIADPTILDLVEADPQAARTPEGPHTRELVERSVRVKAEVVSADLRESGRREMLNYGHTLGHAIERLEGYRWRHGHAVAVGMVYVAELARRAGRLDTATAARHRPTLQAVGLPTRYRAGTWPGLHRTMSVDKKTRAARLRFVVLDGLACPTILDDPDTALLEDAFTAVGG